VGSDDRAEGLDHERLGDPVQALGEGLGGLLGGGVADHHAEAR